MFRVFCALAVAFVTTFHVCGIATASAYAPMAVQALESDGAPQDEASLPGEKCHVCATVSLLALTQAARKLPKHHLAPSPSGRRRSAASSLSRPPSPRLLPEPDRRTSSA